MNAQRRKILYVGNLPPRTGGTAGVNAMLLPGLAALGFDVAALAPVNDRDAAAPDRFALDHPEIALNRFRTPYYEINPFVPAPASYRAETAAQVCDALPGMIAAQGTDLILIGRESYVLGVPEIGARLGVPILAQVHGMTLPFTSVDTLPERMRDWLRELHSVQHIAAVAQHLAAALRPLGLPPMTVIPNAVDTAKFRPGPKDPALLARHGLPADATLVAHFSGLKDIKRPSDLVDAAVLALDRNPHLHFLIIGDGIGRAELEARCHQSGVAHKFCFPGWIERESLPAYFRLADLIVMPSLSEAMSLVYLETMASGRVLLASDIPGSREVIGDGETGILFPIGDVGQLAAAILRLADDRALRDTIGRRARACAMERYRLEDQIAAYASLIDEMLARQRG